MEKFDVGTRGGQVDTVPVELVLDGTLVEEPTIVPRETAIDAPTRPGLFGGLLRFVVGAIIIAIGIGALTDVTAEIRIAISLVGALLLLSGVDRLLKHAFGARTPTALVLAATWIGVVIFSAVFAGLLPISESTNPSRTFTEPVLASPDLWSSHPLGTDRQGLDILGGIIYGFRVSLVVGVGAVTVGLLVGGAIGVIAGYYRGFVDRTVDIFTNSMLAFPPLILLLGVAAVLPRNTRNVMLALAVISIPTYVRLGRANTFVVAQREFVLAARVLGARNRRIIFKDIIPSVTVPLLSYAFVVVAVVIVAEASLSFLGLSVPRPQPTLGNMMAAGQDTFNEYPHLVFLPASALFLTVLSLNRLGEAARKRFDPRDAKL